MPGGGSGDVEIRLDGRTLALNGARRPSEQE